LGLSTALQALTLGAFKLLASVLLNGIGYRPGTVMPVVLGLLAAQGALVGALGILRALVHSLLLLRLSVHRSAQMGQIDPAHWAEALEVEPARPRRALLRLEAAALGVAVLLGISYLVLTRAFDVKDTVEGSAHRGASRVAPENTLAAIRAAIDAGV